MPVVGDAAAVVQDDSLQRWGVEKLYQRLVVLVQIHWNGMTLMDHSAAAGEDDDYVAGYALKSMN